MAVHITALDLTEITGLRIECLECHAGLSLPLRSEREDRLPETCPGCGAEWKTFANSEPLVVAQQLLKAVRYRWETLKAPFVLRLEVAENDAKSDDGTQDRAMSDG